MGNSCGQEGVSVSQGKNPLDTLRDNVAGSDVPTMVNFRLGVFLFHYL